MHFLGFFRISKPAWEAAGVAYLSCTVIIRANESSEMSVNFMFICNTFCSNKCMRFWSKLSWIVFRGNLQ